MGAGLNAAIPAEKDVLRPIDDQSTLSPPKLSVKAVRKTHGAVVALESASLDLYAGEFLTLLGPSGSGKTTLLMIVAGLSEPTAGDVWIDGKLATYVPPHKRDIGLVFQNYALFPHLTVHENIAFPLEMRGIAAPEIARRVREALDTVQLGHAADRFPRELSGGQQQRIALARCIVYRPSIILMDEPLGALDRKLRDQMQFEIKRLHATLGITVLYVTHDQDEAMTMSDRICLMNAGRIEQVGRPEELYFKPQSAFVADFIGDSNFLDVRVIAREGADGYILQAPGGAVIRAQSNLAIARDTTSRLVLRPESLRVLSAQTVLPNSLDGTVRESVFVGSVYRYRIELADGKHVWGKQFSHETVRMPGIGSPVKVGWHVSDGVLLPDGI